MGETEEKINPLLKQRKNFILQRNERHQKEINDLKEFQHLARSITRKIQRERFSDRPEKRFY